MTTFRSRIYQLSGLARLLCCGFFLALIIPTAGCHKRPPSPNDKLTDAVTAESDDDASELASPLRDAPQSVTVGDVKVSLQQGVWKLLDSDPSPADQARAETKSLTIGHHTDPRNTRLVIFVTNARPQSEELFNQFLSKLRGSSEQKISPRGGNSTQLADLQLDCRLYDVESAAAPSKNALPVMHLQACLVANSPRGVFFIQGGPTPQYEAAKADFDAVLTQLKLPENVKSESDSAANSSSPDPSARPQNHRR